MNRLFSAALAAAFFSFSLLSFSAAAQSTIDISRLTPEQKQELQLKVSEMNQEAPIKQTRQTIAQVQEWANFGTAIGAGIVATAKELGVAANDFAKTDLGKTVVNLVIWKYFGRDIMGIVLALLSLGILFPIGLVMIRTAMNSRYDFKYEPYPALWGLVTIKRIVEKTVRAPVLSDSERFRGFIGAMLSLLGILIFAFNIMPAGR